MSEAVTRLEEKIAYLERHVVEQDKAMLEFADELTKLKRELTLIGGRLASGGTSVGGETQSSEERPPHY
jgi:SlyX protein